MPDSLVLSAFMCEWASSLTGIYTIAELKNECTQCCSCLQESQDKSVVFTNLPTGLGDILKDCFTPFYNEFCVLEEEEGDNESIHSNHSDEISNLVTESEGK